MLQFSFNHKLATFCLLISTLTMAGCSSGAFEDRRREAGESQLTYVGDSTPDAPSICYNSMTSTPQDVIRLARSICGKTNRIPVLVKQSKFDCTLLYPSRATYNCVEPEAAGYGSFSIYP